MASEPAPCYARRGRIEQRDPLETGWHFEMRAACFPFIQKLPIIIAALCD